MPPGCMPGGTAAPSCGIIGWPMPGAPAAAGGMPPPGAPPGAPPAIGGAGIGGTSATGGGVCTCISACVMRSRPAPALSYAVFSYILRGLFKSQVGAANKLTLLPRLAREQCQHAVALAPEHARDEHEHIVERGELAQQALVVGRRRLRHHLHAELG